MRSMIPYRLDAAQHAAAMELARRRLQAAPAVRRRLLLTQFVSFALCFAIGFALSRQIADSGTFGRLLMAFGAGLVFAGLQQFLLQRFLFAHISADATAATGARSIGIVADGLVWTAGASSGRIGSAAIEALAEAAGMIVIHLPAGQAFPIPVAAFADAAERAEFHAALRALMAAARVERSTEAASATEVVDADVITPTAGEAAAGAPSAAPAADASAVAGENFAAAFAANLRAGLRVALLLPHEPARASWSQLVALLALGLAIPFAEALLRVGSGGSFASYALPGALFHLPVMLVAAWLAALAAGRVQATLELLVVLAAAQLPVETVYLLLFHAFGGDVSWLPRDWRYYFYYAPFWWLALAFAGTVARQPATAGARRALAALLAGVALVLPLTTVHHDRSLWNEAYDEDSREEYERTQMALVGEDAFYLQPQLLERELQALRPGRKGVVDLYFVGAAGYSGQDVFMKEVRSVAELFRERFDTEGRSVMLINNAKTVAESPIASVTSLRRTLRRIGETMDADEDVLFLFLTSHGSKDHRFSLDFWPLRFHPLDPRRLRELLDESGIRRRVIVVSACYSGGFVEALKDEHTLVIAAAAPDRNSFGCSNEADFTYFGKAYFDEALRQTHSFVEAFAQATPVIAEREKKADFDGSDPRIAVGAAIRAPLAALAAELDEGRRPSASPSPAVLEVARGRYDDYLDLFAIGAQVRQSALECLQETELGAPERLVRKQPDYFGGLGPGTPQWPGLVESYRRYAEEICGTLGDEQLYRGVLRDAWQSRLGEAELDAAMRMFATPSGKRWLAAQNAVSAEAAMRLYDARKARVEAAVQRLQADQLRIFGEYQRERANAARRAGGEG